METPSGKQNMTIINESGLYALVFGSRLECAKKNQSDMFPLQIKLVDSRTRQPAFKKGVYSRSTACFMGEIQPVTYSL